MGLWSDLSSRSKKCALCTWGCCGCALILFVITETAVMLDQSIEVVVVIGFLSLVSLGIGTIALLVFVCCLCRDRQYVLPPVCKISAD